MKYLCADALLSQSGAVEASGAVAATVTVVERAQSGSDASPSQRNNFIMLAT